MPILFEVADRAAHHLGESGAAKTRLMTEKSEEARGAQVQFTDAAPPEILFPPKNAELWAGEVDGKAARPFVLAGRGEGDLRWYVDGRPIAPDDGGMPAWVPDQPGFYRVSAVDEAGRTSAVRVRVLE